VRSWPRSWRCWGSRWERDDGSMSIGNSNGLFHQPRASTRAVSPTPARLLGWPARPGEPQASARRRRQQASAAGHGPTGAWRWGPCAAREVSCAMPVAHLERFHDRQLICLGIAYRKRMIFWVEIISKHSKELLLPVRRGRNLIGNMCRIHNAMSAIMNAAWASYIFCRAYTKTISESGR
jgi:hypothetical protein